MSYVQIREVVPKYIETFPFFVVPFNICWQVVQKKYKKNKWVLLSLLVFTWPIWLFDRLSHYIVIDWTQNCSQQIDTRAGVLGKTAVC